MKAAAEVRLRVLLPDGSPARGLHLILSGWADDAPNTCGITGIPVGVVGYQDRVADTDGEGRCQFGGLPPGSYSIRYVGLVERLEASRRQGLPWRDYSIRHGDGPRDRLAVPVIEVGHLAVGERREIEARAVEGSVLCGTVRHAETGAPIEHACVRYEGPAYPRTGSALQSAYTDAEGRFATHTALVPGPLTLWVSAGSGGGAGSDTRWSWDGNPARRWTSSSPSRRVTRLECSCADSRGRRASRRFADRLHPSEP